MSSQTASILVVDDERVVREGCCRILSRAGYRSESAASGDEAWERMQVEHFDLALIDITTPGLGGMDLMRRAVQHDPDIVCIMVTNAAITIELAAQAIKRGAYDFLAEPLEADRLLMVVSHGLEHRRSAVGARRLRQLQVEKEALEQRNRELEELAHMESVFAAAMAHELRAPTAAILSHLRLMLGGYIPPEEQHEVLLRIERHTENQLQLISDLLDLARLQTPTVQAEREAVHLGDSLMEVCDIMRAQAREKGLGFETHVDLPGPTMLAAPGELRQLWYNLISNAVKYTEPGGAVTVSLAMEETQAVITVQDTGIGIAPDALAHLFEEFYRARPAKEYAEGSTGLGLPIAQRIATTYRGRIDVRSTVGEGSTFTVTLPLDPVPPAQLNSR